MKNNRKLILGIIIGMILMSGVGVVAAIFNAEDIAFTPNDESWEVTNVKEAMDSLYTGVSSVSNLKLIADSYVETSLSATQTSTASYKSNDKTYTVEKDGYLLYRVKGVSRSGNGSASFSINDEKLVSWSDDVYSVGDTKFHIIPIKAGDIIKVSSWAGSNHLSSCTTTINWIHAIMTTES